MTTSISSTGSTSTTATSITSSVQNELGKYEFLKILAAELQYQNPVEPMNSRDFITQLAQFTVLEQTQNMAQNMEEMGENFGELAENLQAYLDNQASLTSSLLVMQSGGLIGKQVVAEVDKSSIEGIVEAVKIRNSLPYAVVGGIEVPVSSIKEIQAVPASEEEYQK